MKKQILGGTIFLICALCGVLALLLTEKNVICHWTNHWHFLVAGLLPIYFAIIIFGAALFGIYFSSAFHRWISRFIK